MARVTVEDCIMRVPNRFDLVMLAAQRARAIGAGAQLTVDRDDDKNPVIALREIAEGTVDLKSLEGNLIQSLQKVVEYDEPNEEELDLLAIQQVLGVERGEAAAAEEVAKDVLQVEEEEPEEMPDEDEYNPFRKDVGDGIDGDEVGREDLDRF